MTPLFTAEQIASRTRTLGQEIRSAAGDSEVFLLGILKGAAVFLGDLMRAVPGDVSYGFIDVIRDVADNTSADAIEIDFLSYTDIRGRSVFLLKDVVSTGVIENYLLSSLHMHDPARLFLVALLDRADARTVDVTADFRMFAVPDGTYAGYGLEHDSRLGNLSHIVRVT